MEMKKHMLYKNTIKLLFLFIILLVSISAISAVDNSTDVTQEMGFNEVMGDRGSGSFTDLQTIIDNTPAGSTMRKHLQEAYLLKLANRLSSVDYQFVYTSEHDQLSLSTSYYPRLFRHPSLIRPTVVAPIFPLQAIADSAPGKTLWRHQLLKALIHLLRLISYCQPLLCLLAIVLAVITSSWIYYLVVGIYALAGIRFYAGRQ